jgi:hypothetical protein
MPDYDLFLLCAECGNSHDVLVRVSLEKSFEISFVSDVYDGAIPIEFYAASCDQKCSTTGKVLPQQNPGEMVLVAVHKVIS